MKHVVCLCRVLYGLKVALLALERVGGTVCKIKAFGSLFIWPKRQKHLIQRLRLGKAGLRMIEFLSACSVSHGFWAGGCFGFARPFCRVPDDEIALRNDPFARGTTQSLHIFGTLAESSNGLENADRSSQVFDMYRPALLGFVSTCWWSSKLSSQLHDWHILVVYS